PIYCSPLCLSLHPSPPPRSSLSLHDALPIFLIVLFYFLLIRPQRKRDKAEREMRNSIEVGDEISTIGGFIGRVVNIKDDVLIIEDRKSTRLNSSHVSISYAVFCL